MLPVLYRRAAAKPAACADSVSGPPNLACNSGQWSMLTGLVSYGWVYCVAHAKKNCRNLAISTKVSHFGGSCNVYPFTNQGQIWQQTVNPRSMQWLAWVYAVGTWVRLHAKFNLNPFIKLPGTKKLQFWADFDIWEALVPPPSYR